MQIRIVQEFVLVQLMKITVAVVMMTAPMTVYKTVPELGVENLLMTTVVSVAEIIHPVLTVPVYLMEMQK